MACQRGSIHLDVGTLRSLATTLCCAEFDVSSAAALRTLINEVDESTRASSSDVFNSLAVNPVDTSRLVARAEQVNDTLLALHGRPCDMNEKLQMQLRGSFLKQQNLPR